MLLQVGARRKIIPAKRILTKLINQIIKAFRLNCLEQWPRDGGSFNPGHDVKQYKVAVLALLTATGWSVDRLHWHRPIHT